MEIGNQQLLVQCPGPCGRAIGRRVERGVDARFDLAGHEVEEEQGAEGGQQDGGGGETSLH